MVKRLNYFVTMLAILLLSGCANLTWTTAGKIIPPVNNACPLQGKWKVLQDISTNGYPGGSNPQQAQEIAQFTRGVAVLGGDVWSNPSYKIKKVNSTDYLMTKYITLASSIVPSNQELDVITVSTAVNFLGDFLQINDRKVIAFVQNKVLILQKVSDQVDSSLAEANPEVADISSQSEAGTSGVLLGLRIPLNNDFKYQTLWLAADNKQLHQVLTSPNIFFPRNSGFWELQVRPVQNGGLTEDVLSARDVSTKVPITKSQSIARIQGNAAKGSQQRIIDYVGNDYVTIENESGGLNQLQVLPVDKISATVGIKLSDLLDNGGLTAYNTSRDQALRELNNTRKILIADAQEQDFGLTRKNGHWYLQGRVNYQAGNRPGHLDFNVNLIPPAKLVLYDTLCTSWQNIKDRVPEAIDAFTSPDRSLALVITKTKLFAYTISNNQLDSEPLAKINLQEGETVVMAEWATGSYVENWEKAFIANGAKAMPDG